PGSERNHGEGPPRPRDAEDAGFVAARAGANGRQAAAEFGEKPKHLRAGLHPGPQRPSYSKLPLNTARMRQSRQKNKINSGNIATWSWLDTTIRWERKQLNCARPQNLRRRPGIQHDRHDDSIISRATGQRQWFNPKGPASGFASCCLATRSPEPAGASEQDQSF